MKLSKKTFLYSIILASGMVALIIVYFVLMLPSLYVDYVMDSNLQSVVDIQKGYMEHGNYEGLDVKNPSAVYSVEIPMEGEKIYVTGKFLKLTLEIQDEELQGILERFRSMMKGWENAGESGDNGEIFTREEFLYLWENGLKDKFLTNEMTSGDYPLRAELEIIENRDVYKEEYYKLHMISDEMTVYEAGVSDGSYGYTTYIAMGKTENAFVVTVLPTMTPRMEEITPVVMGSLPMIIAVVFLAVLVASGFFSRKIVNPIIRLAGYVESAKIAEDFAVESFEADSGDEIGTLGRALNELYEKLRESYLELEGQNRILEEENERQEVFMRASSHQLKTPVAAALLLVEGMINEVGKYKDTKAYLPEVKKQLLSMRKIVEDILELNHRARNPEREIIAVEGLTKEVLKAYEVQIENRKLMLTIKGEKNLRTDREMMKKIIDNLISNSVWHTPKEARIDIEIDHECLCIRNYGSHIDDKLLPNIFEPFVSSDSKEKGKGLGLYVAAYYCRILDCALQIENIKDGVETKMIFEAGEKRYGEKKNGERKSKEKKSEEKKTEEGKSGKKKEGNDAFDN